MRVLHIAPSVARGDGGPAEVIRGLLPALHRRGVEAEVFTTSKGISHQDSDIANESWVKMFSHAGPASLTYSAQLARAVRRAVGGYDLVHIHGLQSHVGSAAMAAARSARVPYLLQPHGALNRYHWSQHASRKRAYAGLMDRANWQGLAALICSSSMEVEEAAAVLPRPLRFKWALGVDPALFNIRREGRGPQKALYLGRITRKKRLDLVLKAMADERVRETQLRLVVAGEPDGTLGLDAAQFVSDAGLAKVVELVGAVDSERRRKLMAEASIFVLPSEDESFGVAVAEAMAAGLAVLTTERVGVARDASDCVRTGADSVEGVVQGLLSLMSPTLDQLGAHARDHAQRHFNWDAISGLAVRDYGVVAGAR